MNASGEFLVSASCRTLFGLRTCDLGWNAVLGLAEGLISLRGNRTTLAFLDERTVLRQVIDALYRDQLSRRLLLPGGSRVFSLLANTLQAKPTPVRFSAGTFVPALLTFLEKGCRIGIAGEDIARIDALRGHFARHAPWHDIVTIAPDDEIVQRCDLIIVDAANPAAERRMERRLSSVPAGLVIMAASGLSGFIEDAPVRVGAKVPSMPAKASFA
ncbi:hypothetical protein [Neorhizobium petrolearium]|uniref:Uncharacterized protein n=1 Tax=Neorhizobium petrolearium TaxID=515361 RepID=A0ABY8M2U6_9HYPH|nr:hypothetical protein [Neorhizobium petrolearium]MCC2608551.1 hypothetical protein [Neorhizobium petrolearium]WGI68817.1 hypothetical protein QEO92_01605 [Neorhizobium petrolearium]